jgi:hypothetical protein
MSLSRFIIANVMSASIGGIVAFGIVGEYGVAILLSIVVIAWYLIFKSDIKEIINSLDDDVLTMKV